MTDLVILAREKYYYNNDTGTLHSIKTGVEVGYYKKADNRRYVQLGDKQYASYRVIYALEFGVFPAAIDHINGNPNDNHISNLREATPLLNSQNLRKAMKCSKTGVLGVSPRKGKFIATLNVNGRQMYCGTFTNACDAEAVYLQAKRQFHEGCTL